MLEEFEYLTQCIKSEQLIVIVGDDDSYEIFDKVPYTILLYFFIFNTISK